MAVHFDSLHNCFQNCELSVNIGRGNLGTNRDLREKYCGGLMIYTSNGLSGIHVAVKKNMS